MADAAVDGLTQRRQIECRLALDRRLVTLEEAEGWLADRQLVTRTADCSLPSLYEACPPEDVPADAPAGGARGFATWPRERYWWFPELGEREGVLLCKVHRGKNLLVTGEALALLDPICRAELARMRESDADWRRLLDYLADAGPAPLEQVQQELGWRAPELRAIRSPLERCGALVARSVVVPAADEEGHLHSSELARWDQRIPEPLSDLAAGEAVVALTLLGVRAAVVAREAELAKWFSWKWRVPADLVDRVVATGQAERVPGGWVGANLPE